MIAESVRVNDLEGIELDLWVARAAHCGWIIEGPIMKILGLRFCTPCGSAIHPPPAPAPKPERFISKSSKAKQKARKKAKAKRAK